MRHPQNLRAASWLPQRREVHHLPERFFLPSAIEPLQRAATVTADELVRDFLERQARYLAEQTRRLRQVRS